MQAAQASPPLSPLRPSPPPFPASQHNMTCVNWMAGGGGGGGGGRVFRSLPNQPLWSLYIRAHAFLLPLRPSPSPILFQRCFLFSFAVRSVTGLTTARTASTKTF